MHCLHIRRQSHRKLQRLFRSRTPSLHRNDHDRRRQDRLQHHPALQNCFFFDQLIMMPYPPHEQQHRRQQQHHHPRPFNKLRHHDDHHRDPCRHGSQPVEKNVAPRLHPRSRPPPMPHHPRLRQGERHKRAHRKQWNQPVRHPAKQNQQQRRKYRQCPDPLREHQPPSPRGQRMRKIIVAGDHPAQPRKIRKRRIRRKTKHQQYREHRQIVKNPLARHRRRQHRQHALISRRPRIRSRNPVIPHQHRDSPQQHNQNRNDRRQRGPSRRNHRLPKSLHSITDRFHPSQSRAPRSKRLNQNPNSHQLHRRSCGPRRSHDRHRMSARYHHLIKPNQNHHHQSPHKQICGGYESRPRFLNPAKIDDRQYNQHRQTQRQCMRQQRGHRRNQSSDPRRYSHRHIQQVIDHQSRARQQPRSTPQILPSDRVRSAAIRISRNRLPITEINNRQQRDHRKSQRHDVPNSHQPQRQQNRQSRLRTVSRRTQSIEPKSRNSLSRSNPLPFVLRRSQRPPKQNVKYSHIPS